MGVLDSVWQPGHVKAREDLDGRHERAQEAPSPGDRLLDSGRLVVERPEDAERP